MVNKNELLKKLKKYKEIFKKDGILLLGFFGSFARDEQKEDSDIDILIEITPKFLKTYQGFRGFSKLEEIKKILEDDFDLSVDIVDKKGLLQHNNKYILESAVYV